ncbi:GTP-binding protein [Kytococcus sedentarius]|uniref:GTP-binding protein n=1 Tax=Kytococcus sedentarius TaxID=1276 RepID=UPI00194E5E53|nr:GTP-binding protein [Kytococcus sedentarius]QRO86938.1 GTP-binding protein [Kytococcus sedentarius]
MSGSGSDARMQVVVLAGTDEVDLATATLAVQCDLPDAVVVRHELDEEAGTVRRVVSDATGVLEDATRPMEHACQSCALREDLVPTLLGLAHRGEHEVAVVVLPDAAELLPVGAALGADAVDPRVPELLDLRAVTAVVDPADLVARVTVGAADPDVGRRSAAAVLQAEYADVVVLGGCGPAPEPEDLTFLRHLTRSEARVVPELSALTASVLLAVRHDVDRVGATHDPRRRRPTGAPDAHGIATAVFESRRPLHPERLMSVMEPMVLSSLRTRGAFWLPTRPEAALVWDECCGQLRLGSCGQWSGHQRTCLVVTAYAEDLPEFRRHFEHALLTDEELVAANRWAGRSDGFEEWVGAA